MNLTNEFPRSPYDMNAGLVMLPRTTDKCKAHLAGTLGEYHYDCPLDKRLFTFLGVNAETFTSKVKEFEGDDEKIAGWINSDFSKTQEEKNEFNNKARHAAPEDEESKKWIASEKERLGKDYFTYFDNLDADEGRF